MTNVPVPRPTLADRLRRDRALRAELGLDEYLTTAEAAALLRCNEWTLRHYRQDGTGPPSVKLGAKVLYRRSDIDAWADAQANGGTP